MIELELVAKGKEQEKVKEYLENNVSEILAEKINNGVKITKDNKTLLNKKDLNGFMKFACDEARKQAEKGSNSACIEDEIVYGWAIHYFEEDSIEGNLYNEDGNEYKVAPKVVQKPITTKSVTTQENKQATLFDMLETPKTEIEQEIEQEKSEEENENVCECENACEDDWTEEEMQDALEQEKEVLEINNQLIDAKTGELIKQNDEQICSIDKEYAEMLSGLLNGKLEVK